MRGPYVHIEIDLISYKVYHSYDVCSNAEYILIYSKLGRNMYK